MNTRSVSVNSVCGFGRNQYGGAPASSGSGPRSSWSGPNAPRCSQTADDPGPPLNRNVIGLREASVTPSFMYAMLKMLARGLPSRPSRKVSSATALNGR